MRSRASQIIGLGMATLLLPACGGSAPAAQSGVMASTAPASSTATDTAPASGGSPSGSSSSTPSKLTTTPSPTSAKTASKTASTTAKTGSTKPGLVLRGDGLELVVAGTKTTVLKFGTATKDQAVMAVTLVLGAPTLNDLPECGQGPRTGASVKRFSLLFDGTKFVGWTEPGAAGRHLTTAGGLGLGTPVKTLKHDLAGFKTFESSLGHEWMAGIGLSGLVSSTAPTGTVTFISGGETCYFR